VSLEVESEGFNAKNQALDLIKTSFLIAIYLAPSTEKGIDSVDLDANSLNEKR
jgi:hypothetical protein